MSDESRACSVCRQVKPMTDFHVNVTKLNGRETACKQCVRARRRGHHTTGKARKYNPDRDRARGRVRDAVRYGRLTKPSNCQACGAPTPARLLDGHHFNGYDRPLDVEWLCRGCHALKDAA